MNGHLTDIQQAIYDYLKEVILQRGYPPSVREICEAVGLKSTSSVHGQLEKLEKYGYIRRDPSKPRAIEITDDDFGISRREMISLPMVGHVAAGEPILAEQNIEGYFPFPADMLPLGEHFMLKVRGDSMINMGILSGDSVICQKRDTAANGEVVVAMVDDSATVKRFYKEDGHYRLQPENDDMEPIIVDHCEVIAKVIGVMRMLQ